jgi:hypothetical protein
VAGRGALKWKPASGLRRCSGYAMSPAFLGF